MQQGVVGQASVEGFYGIFGGEVLDPVAGLDRSDPEHDEQVAPVSVGIWPACQVRSRTVKA